MPERLLPKHLDAKKKYLKRLEPLKARMIKGFSLFLKIFWFYSFFTANSVNIHKESLLDSLLEKMERTRLELVTPTLPVWCATSCANAPYELLKISKNDYLVRASPFKNLTFSQVYLFITTRFYIQTFIIT